VQHLVEHHPQRPDIRARIVLVGLSRDLLRGHVLRGAQHRSGPGQPCLVGTLGQPEIGQDGAALPVEQHVGWFEVPVDHALAVCMMRGIADLDQCLHAPLEWQLVHHLGQRPALHQVHHQIGQWRIVGVGLVDAHLMDRDDAGMVQARGQHCLALKTLDRLLVTGPALEQLDRHGAT